PRRTPGAVARAGHRGPQSDCPAACASAAARALDQDDTFAAGRHPGRRRRSLSVATLELYLIRHGVAAERGEDFPDDSKRPLTNAGISRLRKEAKALDGLGVAFDHIITSPLVRPKQTADIFAEALKSKPSVSQSDALAPAGTSTAVVQELAKHMRKGRIALVGHQPKIGELSGRRVVA